MRSLKILSITVSFLAVLMSATNAFADAGISCASPGHSDPHWMPDRYNDKDCYSNPADYNYSQCYDLCSGSVYCLPYESEILTNFGGFWRAGMGSQSDFVVACRDECLAKKELCDPEDQTCLDEFIPVNTYDCSLLEDYQDQTFCNEHCTNDILTSQCVRNCLDSRCDDYCSDICVPSSDYDYYCASIPVKYETRWNLFAILMALLTALTAVVLVVVNRNNKTRAEDQNS